MSSSPPLPFMVSAELVPTRLLSRSLPTTVLASATPANSAPNTLTIVTRTSSVFIPNLLLVSVPREPPDNGFSWMVPGTAWCSEPFDVYLDGIAVEVHAAFELAVGKLHLSVEESALATPFVHEAEAFVGEE